jgi:hypothetical protein
MIGLVVEIEEGEEGNVGGDFSEGARSADEVRGACA